MLLPPSAVHKLKIHQLCLPLFITTKSSPSQKGPAFSDSNFHLQLHSVEKEDNFKVLHIWNMAVCSGLPSFRVSCDTVLSWHPLHSTDERHFNGCRLLWGLQIFFPLLLLLQVFCNHLKPWLHALFPPYVSLFISALWWEVWQKRCLRSGCVWDEHGVDVQKIRYRK